MVTLEELENLADSETTDLSEVDCLQESQSCIYEDDNGHFHIGLQKGMDRLTKKIRIAHELGHAIHGGTYSRNTPHLLRAKAEYLANKHSAFLIAPPEEVLEAVRKGITETWELAEYFDIPCDEMMRILELYRNHGVA